MPEISHGLIIMGDSEAEILTDEQIDELLTQAEARLRAKAQAPNDDEILFQTTGATSKSRKTFVPTWIPWAVAG